MKDSRNIHENDSPASKASDPRLAERPERTGRRRVTAMIFLLCGCLIILGGGGVLVWQLTSHPSGTLAVSNTTPSSPSSSTKMPVACTGAREPVDVIMQQTAHGLHLSVAQVQARVLADKTITQIAAEQGLTPTQLRNIEVQALRYSNNHWLNMGCITQQDLQDNLRRDTGDPAYMDEEFTQWFKG